jgi:phenylalanyl-tRNA synthetase beta chain
MNVSYAWLRAFVPFDETPAALRDLITSRVATVDELTALRADLAPIVIARVVEEGPHPDSDHLHVTKVDAGTGELLDVVCGAPNVTAGKLYPFAPSGTVMPDGKKIERRKIRGAVSNGMLCSVRELGLGEEQEGIWELDLDVAPGTPFLRAMPVGDARIVIDVGANRPDLLSHLGVAREIAAATDRELALPRIEGLDARIPEPRRTRDAGVTGGATVRIDEAGLVRRFMGVVIRGVRVGPSPSWMVERLQSVGSRSINNVVDASNYVLHELGQPTHAFDLARLGGSTVVVRRARAGERLTTLDGADRPLDPEMIVIADAQKAQAIAGIMGGAESEVTDATTDIFLEVANFDPSRIRTARKRLGMSTDASYRFERGVDVGVAPRALERVAQLIVLLADGRIDDAPLDAYAGDTPRAPLILRVRRVAQVLGEPIPGDEIASLLRRIGFDADLEASADTVRVLVPSWRGDVVQEIDLVEEVARLRGYDSFPDEIRPFRAGNVPDDPQWLAARRVRDHLVGLGLLETRPLPFVRGGDGFVRVANPIAENEAYLRQEILETLARRTEFNLAHMRGDVRLFEIGSVFSPGSGAMPIEHLRVGVLVMGRRAPAHFTDPKSPEFAEWAAFSEWDAKGIAEQLASVAYPGRSTSLVADETRASTAPLWTMTVDGAPVGTVARVALDAPVWATPAFGIELSLGRLESEQVAPPGSNAHRPPAWQQTASMPYRPIPTTPAAEFDLALLLPPGVSAAAVEQGIRGAAGDLLERLELFDEYVGEGVETGHRSVAWRLTLRHPERTLSAKEIEGRRNKILSVLASELDVRQRSA